MIRYKKRNRQIKVILCVGILTKQLANQLEGLICLMLYITVIPIAFEIVSKPIQFSDIKTKKVKRHHKSQKMN